MNPFENHTSKKEEKNRLLINKAIELINKSSGELSYHNVARMTQAIDDKEKGITASGISRNDRHKSAIDLAVLEKEKSTKNIIQKDYEDLEVSELQANLFIYKIENQELLQQNKALENELKTQNVKSKRVDDKEIILPSHNINNTTLDAFSNIINYLIENNLAIKNTKGEVVSILDNHVLVDANTLKIVKI